ncbi:hypothetical protein [Bradyrhizobium sp. SZCCHNS2005]|uniref:hypothetical protein n=1 Tax=Bradyrhizobium sp. SZCCHNS2005 TaxID=3057303 RepID=UPI0028EEA6BB|nr:hypothetical protein [Bradyrhizobium sp. SZCCHNS2005]
MLRNLEWRHAVNAFAIDLQGLAAGSNNNGIWCQANDSFCELCGCPDEMLAIIQDDEEAIVADNPSHSLRRHRATVSLQADGLSHRSRQQARIGERSQLDEPNTGIKSRQQTPRQVNRKHGFSNATRTGESDNPIRRAGLLQELERSGTPDKFVRSCGQVC